MGNPVVYFEINGPDGPALEKFYGELFGWAMQPMAPEANYTLVDTHGRAGINGGIGTTRDGSASVMFYAGVSDLQATLDRAPSLGGRTATPVTEIPNVPIAFARLADPDELVIGLVQITERDEAAPGPSAGDGAPVDWFEVIGSDARRTQRFYCDLLGWTIDDSSAPGYGMVNTDAGGRGISGGLGAASEDAKWVTVYAHVRDVETTLARAEELGGARVYGPNVVDDHMKTGAFRDPAGLVFGVYEHEHN
jgi:predicted enzyme related to lactoylglutathione lyase